jgi:hypothetical protein
MTYELIERNTLRLWQAVSKANPVNLEMQRAQRWVEDACLGLRPGVMLSGEAGAGKTHLVDEAMAAVTAKGVKPIRRILRDDRMLLETIQDSKGVTPIILEECDALFRSPNQINILKMATDDGKRAPKMIMTKIGTVRFGAPIILVTNSNPSDDRNFDRKLVDDIAAIRSRMPPIHIKTDPLAMWEYTCYLAIVHNLIRHSKFVNNGKIERRSVTADQQNTVLRFYAENLFRLGDRSPRGLTRIAQAVYLTKNKSQRDTDLNALLIRTRADAEAMAPDGWPPYVPTLFGPDGPRGTSEPIVLGKPAPTVSVKPTRVPKSPMSIPEALEVMEGVVADLTPTELRNRATGKIIPITPLVKDVFRMAGLGGGSAKYIAEEIPYSVATIRSILHALVDAGVLEMITVKAMQQFLPVTGLEGSKLALERTLMDQPLIPKITKVDPKKKLSKYWEAIPDLKAQPPQEIV